VELIGCPFKILDDLDKVSAILLDTAKFLNVNVLQQKFHKFAPQGVSGYILIAESHLSVHTWPERGYAAIDLFTCGERNLLEGLTYLKKRFKAKEDKHLLIYRGDEGFEYERG
jgi:S-adenosylmethionine decarboxylase